MGANQSSSAAHNLIDPRYTSHSATLHLNPCVTDKDVLGDKEKCVNTSEFRRTASARFISRNTAEHDGPVFHQQQLDSNGHNHRVLIHHQPHSHDYLHVEYRANGHKTHLLPDEMPTEPASASPLARNSPARSSILRGSFRRIKAQLSVNVPPPVVPDDKLHRLSNASLASSSSGFGSSGSANKTPESTESNGSLRRNPGNLKLKIVVPPATSGDAATAPPPNGPGTPAAANPPNRLPLAPNYHRDPAPLYSPTQHNGFHNSTSAASRARSPFASPLPSPLTPQSAGGLGSFSNLHYSTSENKPLPVLRSPGDVYPVMYRSDVKNPVNGNGLANGRCEYVELMCSNEAAHREHPPQPYYYYNYDPDLISDESSVRNSRSSFSSFDGSSYSAGSFTNSPNSVCGGSAPALDLMGMLNNGMTDNEVLSAWLGSIGLTDYFPHFIQAGYDMPTIQRMTTEDLTGIGISKPSHRKRFRAEITRLPNMDAFQFGSDIPVTMNQLLSAVKLSEYTELFAAQRLHSVDDMLNLTWEDLEEIGVKKLGHLKKLTLGIRHFRALKRHTVLLEQEQQLHRENTHSPVAPAPPNGHLAAAHTGATDDTGSGSASIGSGSSGARPLPAAPLLTTFQAPPSGTTSPSKKLNGHLPELRRPHSAHSDRPGGPHHLALPNGSSPTPRSPAPSPGPLASLQPLQETPDTPDTTKTLPRRKSTRTFAQRFAQAFHKDPARKKSTPCSPEPPDPRKPHPEVGDPVYPPPSSNSLSSFAPTTLAALASPRANQLLSRHPGGPPTDPGDLGEDVLDLAAFPPPPSPLLRGLHALEELSVDTERTPTLPHRRLLPPEVPFARDDLGTVRQRAVVPPRAVCGPTTFCDPRRPPGGGGQCEVLDEISGMLASLTCELDQAMVQLEAAEHG
ncbi:LOW QUALITY PROTEIN: uncharacterized protein LOC129598050 [Paramacrobiotus metropolitanus]|uniref:LOW QUALITY PROTEIN: uncharacterized protein LOC129598050 n=1 Tax=Paramacrobiotus metropolitanus TaxID=2943436 RepID=UPI002445BE2C|nr:LOW QUALITY PROTEIN: uncharacterized protein LOC129598050 [Paramacrobiotus metropolitanus]